MPKVLSLQKGVKQTPKSNKVEGTGGMDLTHTAQCGTLHSIIRYKMD